MWKDSNRWPGIPLDHRPGQAPMPRWGRPYAVIYWRRSWTQRLMGVFVTILGLEFLMYAIYGEWGKAIVTAGTQALALLALCYGWYWATQRLRRWWHSLLLVVVLGTLLSGCTDVVRGVAKLHGYKGDIYAQPCAPESLQVGSCVPAKPEGTKP